MKNAKGSQKVSSVPVLDSLTNACISGVSQRTGVPSDALLQHIVRAWYEINFDVEATHLRLAIKRSKRDAKKWGTPAQAA
jgi:hypothetical protein